MQFMVSQQSTHAPGILIAHGFAGSKQLMLGYAYTLAHNGYGVLLWDQLGHGGNAQRFNHNLLQKGVEAALSTLKQQPEINPQHLAILGHSMGSGVAMKAGIQQPRDFDAVVAISPTDAPVSPELPRNLSLQAGEGEPRFVDNATRLLKQAGGVNPNVAQGKGRSLSIIPGVEHITILFNDASHQSALKWLNETFGKHETNPYRDRRMGWYGLQLLGWLIVIGTIIPHLRKKANPLPPMPRPQRAVFGLVLSPIAAASVLKGMSLSSDVGNLGGLLVGGALGFWFFIAGLAWLAMIAKLPKPRLSELGLGLASFALMWIGLGGAAQVVWLPWILNTQRLALWLPIAIACLPWFLATGMVQQNVKLLTRLGWWFGQSAAIVIGLILTILLVPSLSFMVILLPVFPLLFGLFSFLCAKLESPWAFALGSAPILSWLIVTLFPLI
ncbi:MAG: lysophospholipase [Aphanocapsa sp. GSE-SYN-MK-11-07L]|nr:lysophospholipase [Aphanocapsa sp. GSE-SYN-MK-11-07L]